MKMVIAMIRPEAVETVKEALFKAGIHKMSVSHMRGCGQQKGFVETYRGHVTQVNLLPKVRIEIAVNDDFVKRTVNTIMDAARTGNIGDGKIFVMPIDECFRIRSGEEGNQAIG